MLNQRVRQCVARHRCQGGCRCADIAVLLLSRIWEDFRRAAIAIVKDVAPSNWRWLLMRQYSSLAPVIEEVAVQSHHHSLAAVKNSRRLPTCCHRHRQGGCTAKSKGVAYAPTFQSCHSCWGGFCKVLSLQFHRRQEFEENRRCGRSRQQPIQQTDFPHEQEGGGGHKQEIKRESMDRGSANGEAW